MRTISDRQGMTLKAAIRRAIEIAGGARSFAAVTRIKEGNLSKYGSPNEEHAETFMPIDVAVEADLEAGSPIIVSAMAEMLGFKLVPINGVDENATVVTAADALNIANETGDVIRSITSALADGKICAADRKDITREVDEAVKALKIVLKKVGA